ncbi:hypothetical protein CFC21_074121 [Triticum aestivum]|uniref:DUF1618 domain-containing protein n=2 Tax=Triticum TaxID=4564 RepID=A0A9R1KVY6_WHEAT|nr:hypothetical protein CFC21_074098 [Triticum aestivum]KAF7068351.1 hypothetical protein CFC21_074121 [Triticum aestivum]VAI38315.1 unnamed protein product [Triticum turgidum subsp. durum]
MVIAGEPEPEEVAVMFSDRLRAEEETVVFPGWVMLDRIGRTHCDGDLGAAREAVNGNKTAVQVEMDSGHSFYVSFTLAPPPQGASYLDLHWPLEGSAKSVPPYKQPAYPFVRAIDKDLVLFHISIPSLPHRNFVPPDLFVYNAAGHPPSVQQLPLYRRRSFLRVNFTTGILRRQNGSYIVSDLNVYPKKEGTGNNSMCAELCVFNSNTRAWSFFSKDAPQPQDQSNGQFPTLWSTDHVLAFDSRFLCWVDYFSGVLLSDFSNLRSRVLHFVPFPGEGEYPAKVRVQRCFPDRFRSVSISNGKMCFVHIDNDFHERIHTGSQGQQPRKKITIWTLNMMDGNSRFKWEPHRVIYLDGLLPNPHRLPEFPIISADDPDVLCCLLRKEEFHGEASMVMIDMEHARLRSSTPYINRQSVDEKAHKNEFLDMPLLPTVFSKHIERPTGMPWDNHKLATRPSKKLKSAM